MRAIELFAGAGGLGMGVSLAGFTHEAVIEWNSDACDTLRENQRRGTPPVADWPLVTQGDVREYDFGSIKPTIDLVAGGPPCQPFSLGGKHKAYKDRRDMWPEAARAVRELRPRAFLFENVRGLVRPAFAEYFDHIILSLKYPEIMPRADENWREHRARLTWHDKRGGSGLRYRVAYKVLNASDFGVPQHRQRVFIVGFREDVEAAWEFPKSTHSAEALAWSKWVSGAYWKRHGVKPPRRPDVGEFTGMFPPELLPWRTVRDAIAGLPEAVERQDAEGVLNHRLQLGARSYPGHTGSPLDAPAKTLKAGAHGVPGGENMLALPDGQVRYFTVRESARLQTFPDTYVFSGVWSEAMRQIGNAVPTALALAVAKRVHSALEECGARSAITRAAV